MTQSLILKRGSANRSSGQWRDDDYDVLENGVIVGRIFISPAAPQRRPWMWASGHNGDSRARVAVTPYLYRVNEPGEVCSD